MTPSQFRNCDYADQIEMIAEMVASAKMANYENFLNELEMERLKRKKR